MKPPPYILGAALLFWGWRASMFWVGALAGVLLELSNFIRSRWAFTDKEFNRLWDICTVLFVAAAAYLRFSEDISSAAYKFFEWMPLIFYPMVLGYTYSIRDAVPMKAFSWLLRRKGAQGGDRGIAFGWIYLVICIVGTGATNAQDIWFFVGSTALVGWAIWSNRPKRIPAFAWCLLFGIIAGIAFYGQSRMLEIQAFFENKVSELIVRFGGRREFDPDQTRTAMGRIGSLKQSGRVVMKLKPNLGPVPERLLECTYVRLDGTVWRSGGRGGVGSTSFESVPVETDTTTWNIQTNKPTHAAVRIIQRVNRKSALLTVPFGTKQLKELSAGAVETNRLSVIRVKDNPGLLNFVARYGPVDDLWEGGRRFQSDDEEAIAKIADELQIDKLPARQKIAAITRFFQEKFRYTTYQQAHQLGLHNRTPLSRFLELRAGHCEYFASATVLLLRHYNIPARYATGYAVQELAKEEDAYIIRERHGHAWAIAEVGNEWIEVDTTPSGWAEAEAEEFSSFQDLEDAWSRFVFGFLEWRWLGDWTFFRLAAPWLVIPLTLFLVWRIFGRRMSREKPSIRLTEKWPGADSEFFTLERRLARKGHGRQNDETTVQWLARMRTELPAAAEMLTHIMRLHQKYRFAEAELEPAERDELRQAVKLCLTHV